MENTDWKHLPFAYMKTDYNVRCYCRNGQWGELEICSSAYINMHMAATCLHYGQEAFEGLKAFCGKDGRIRVFRWRENAKRMYNTAIGIKMVPVPEEIFGQAVFSVIRLNKRFIPPYGHGASLYIRPLLIGTGAEVGVKPAKDYLFVVFVTPVGPYFKEGFKPVDVMICRSHDRAAPLGTGAIKVGGNYAASLTSLEIANKKGYSTTLYLDAKEKKYIDEAGPANFFGIKKNMYITPESKSILPSITNMSLMDLARKEGMTVEKRPVPVDELNTFDEVGACGTAAVITPIRKIVDPDLNVFYEYCKDGHPGPVSTRLYKRLTAIQYGDEEDQFHWIDYIE
ncbi:MAG: branched-chain amino acid aminotransferase [Bacteroidales bacterium]|nr:branched-chain amino acid aminotransferase [Bacteroidales bacterium]MBN2764038.1 branched-chain amino acid aminotransferase [Bacteroidales bacterium]